MQLMFSLLPDDGGQKIMHTLSKWSLREALGLAANAGFVIPAVVNGRTLDDKLCVVPCVHTVVQHLNRKYASSNQALKMNLWDDLEQDTRIIDSNFENFLSNFELKLHALEARNQTVPELKKLHVICRALARGDIPSP